jgi:hypothetical protein
LQLLLQVLVGCVAHWVGVGMMSEKAVCLSTRWFSRNRLSHRCSMR